MGREMVFVVLRPGDDVVRLKEACKNQTVIEAAITYKNGSEWRGDVVVSKVRKRRKRELYDISMSVVNSNVIQLEAKE